MRRHSRIETSLLQTNLLLLKHNQYSLYLFNWKEIKTIFMCFKALEYFLNRILIKKLLLKKQQKNKLKSRVLVLTLILQIDDGIYW